MLGQVDRYLGYCNNLDLQDQRLNFMLDFWNSNIWEKLIDISVTATASIYGSNSNVCARAPPKFLDTRLNVKNSDTGEID